MTFSDSPGWERFIASYAGATPEYDEYIISQSQMKLTPHPEKADNLFLYYLFTSEQQQNYIRSNSIQTGVPHTNLGILRNTPLRLPPLPIQRQIAAILSAFDDKIELNRQMNRTLEQMARALFKSWFVDFDPVRARMRGEMPEGMDAETAALFPSELVEVEGREVPKGWEWGTVGQNFKLTMGQSPPGDTYNGIGDGFPFYQGKTDFGFRFPSRRIYCKAPTRFAESGDVLISVRAPVGDANIAIEDCAVGRGVAAIQHIYGSTSFTYYAMRNAETFFSVFNGEGTVFGSINKKSFESLEILNPTKKVMQRFDELAGSFDRKILSNEKESTELAQLRDALLPRLLSGEVDVGDWAAVGSEA